MKCTIVNFAQFVRYLADRASIKLTQFAMKNVSAGRAFRVWNYFYVCVPEREARYSGFRFISILDSLYLFHTRCKKRGLKNLMTPSIHIKKNNLINEILHRIFCRIPYAISDFNSLARISAKMFSP